MCIYHSKGFQKSASAIIYSITVTSKLLCKLITLKIKLLQCSTEQHAKAQKCLFLVNPIVNQIQIHYGLTSTNEQPKKQCNGFVHEVRNAKLAILRSHLTLGHMHAW